MTVIPVDFTGWPAEKRAAELSDLANNEAEQALLGALFIDNRSYHRVAEIVSAEDFSNAAHARVYQAIGDLVERGQQANPVTLKGIFDRDEALVPVGGARYLAQLASAAITLINTVEYAAIVADLAKRRRLVLAAEDMRRAAFDVTLDQAADTSNIIELHQARLATIRPSKGNVATDPLPVAGWRDRDMSEPDFLLGELLSTTGRLLLVGPSGIGKSNFLLALGMAIADGADYLHWHGCGKPRRVLYIDGEMSRRLAKRRIVDAIRRHGNTPDTLFYLNSEDYPQLEPLNTPEGQKFIDAVIEKLGGVDLIIFDNIQALLAGDMKEEEPWRQTLPWVRSLTSRNIGQIWAHHTGYDESHGYGTKTRDWQLDTVLLMERVERPEVDITFSIKFTKARERGPDNRSDFEKAVITLENDEWSSERGTCPGQSAKAKDRALELLEDAIIREGVVPPANEHVPPDTLCVTEATWRRYCEAGSISESATPEAVRKAFYRATKKLVGPVVGKWMG